MKGHSIITFTNSPPPPLIHDSIYPFKIRVSPVSRYGSNSHTHDFPAKNALFASCRAGAFTPFALLDVGNGY